MFGLLNIDKPFDVTSRDVVNEVQRLVRPHKVGHAGTLDPLATGVLVIGVGQATRLIEYVQQLPKRYCGTFLLGRRSDTEDTEGQVVPVESAPQPTRTEIEQQLPRFVGDIMQRPPAFSALKVKGQRAYALARRGQAVELEPRRVTVHRLEITEYTYPVLTVEVTCGSGTYIRSLGRDLGDALGTGAVMSALQRTAIGDFTLDQACSLRQLTRESIDAWMLPPRRAVEHLPCLEVSDEQVMELSQGRCIAGSLPAAAPLAAAVDRGGHLVALLSATPQGALKPHRYFPSS